MRLTDSITIHYIPFHIAENVDISAKMRESELWQYHPIKVENNTLYDHVADFMNSKMPDDTANGNGCVIYSLNSKSQIASRLNNKIFHIDAKGHDISFKFCNDKKMSSPKLVLYPKISIGVLTFGVEINHTENTIPEELMELNYMLHKLDKQAPEITRFYGNKQPHEKSLENDRMFYKKMSGQEDAVGFTIPQIINAMLADFSNDETRLVNKSRTHLFTYLQIDKPVDKQFKETYVRILRAENANYAITENDLDSKYFTQTFENIYVGSCLEGVVIAVSAGDDTTTFIKQYKSRVLLCYFWIYFLVYIQRLALIHITSCITSIKHADKLSLLVEQLSEIKLNTYFPDISDYTQHNEFYKLCSKNLNNSVYLESVSDKISSLYYMLDRQHQEKEEIHNNQLRKINEEETEFSNQMNQRIALLTSAQICFAAMVFFDVSINIFKLCNFRYSIGEIILMTFCVVPVGYFIYHAAKLISLARKKTKQKRHKK